MKQTDKQKLKAANAKIRELKKAVSSWRSRYEIMNSRWSKADDEVKKGNKNYVEMMYERDMEIEKVQHLEQSIVNLAYALKPYSE